MARLALLIGISEYQPGLATLPNAVKDVEAMRRVLENPEMGAFMPENVKVLKNPQRQEMEKEIYSLYANCQKDDLVLFYFSGHGVTVENGDFYFSTCQTEKNQNKLLPFTAVAATSVHSWMNQSKSKRQVVILDCCFSAAFVRGVTAKDIGNIDLQKQLGGEGRAILTACTSTQKAYESDDSHLSIYTHYLVEGIEKGAADIDDDGWIAVDELHSYVKSKVQEESPDMKPELYYIKKGEPILLAKSPKDDPRLKYRKEFEKIALEDEGEISELNRLYLHELQNTWRVAANEAHTIELEVLEPYRKRQEKLQRYEQALSKIKHYPLTEKEHTALKRLQNILNIRDEDIEPIAQRVFSSFIKTQPFDFEMATIKVTSKGFLGIGKSYYIQRRRGRAEYFAEDLGNGVILEMVAIPGGKFLMGSPENEPEKVSREIPQHTVSIQSFFMGGFTITQAQWQVVAAFDKVNIDLKSDPSYFKGAHRPVECVSWDDAVEFCARLSQKTNKTYRLPSEAEWEYACRAGTTTPFYFGETISTDLANYNGNHTYNSSTKGKYRRQTTNVGEFPANLFGLFDMHGNVWEWCQDDWHEDYKNAPTNGSAWLSDNNKYRLVRGGSWFDSPWHCRTVLRYSFEHYEKNNSIGFRTVCIP